ncbi:putative mitotic spindle checkpoint protein [Talaromyces proteolyticus]|uniref:Mitotic spindle checkpoint protein n=1 Tax=Talaromyces proteolyticus TaxID=1131652 RepID=A0AAD4KPU1_9EURO|nr:putative mitotic spindle checkpoint protein [Talaromyces proteolyticus]KAH8696639.1 putative mitotic spindle checkpoint protein [Talaromyces proteolyticus]
MATTSETSSTSTVNVNSMTTTTTTPLSAPNDLPNTQAAIAASFTNFLSVAMHQILWLRNVYPRATFLPVRAYNYPVRQSRHPKVCDYINDVAIAVESEILKGTITAVTVIISSVRTNQPMERYAFDLSGFPHVPVGELYTTFEERKEEASKPASTAQTIDLEAQFRACLARLASACARLTPLPRDDEFGFTVCIEVREDALPPAGTTKEEQTWIVAEPGQVHVRSCTAPFSVSKVGSHSQQPLLPKINGRAKTVPVRKVEAGELRLELWVEEARQKFEERLVT